MTLQPADKMTDQTAAASPTVPNTAADCKEVIAPSGYRYLVPLEWHDFRWDGTLNHRYPITSCQAWESQDDRKFNQPGVL